MPQRFDSRQYSIRDFEEWNAKNELVLDPKFQRRYIWPPKARSYLIDSVIRGKPIPKIYMRQEVNPKTRLTRREIVDGQQRLRTVLDFLKDAFPILKTHNDEYGGKTFSQLDDEIQRTILQYEFTVDLLQDMPDSEIFDIFARMNTFSMTLNAQELRNAQWFGEFKTSVYGLAGEFMKFWQDNLIFPNERILRMAEVEFVSELLIAMSEGIRARAKSFIDSYYKDHDDKFSNRKSLEKRFRVVMDNIGGIFATYLSESKLREARLLYPLFCAIYHMQYGLPELTYGRKSIKPEDYPKIRIALQKIDSLFEKLEKETERQERIIAGESEEDLLEEEKQQRIDAGEPEEDVIEDIEKEAELRKVGMFDPLTAEERAFYDAYSIHWVHADRRKLCTEFICKLIINALR